MRKLNYQVITNQDYLANCVSAAINTEFVVRISVQAVVDEATGTGVVNVQASNDPGTPVNWTDIPNATVTLSDTSPQIIPAFDIAYKHIRVKFVSSFTGVAGLLNATVKTVGF